jgi:hypothetical protein
LVVGGSFEGGPYWDAGYVKVGFTDVHASKYLGDTDFTNPDPDAAESRLRVPPEGNAHQAEFTMDNRYVVGADEDFAPYAPVAQRHRRHRHHGKPRQ